MAIPFDDYAIKLIDLQMSRARLIAERQKLEGSNKMTEALEREFASALEIIADQLFEMTEELAQTPANHITDIRTKAMFVLEYIEDLAGADLATRLTTSIGRDLVQQNEAVPYEQQEGERRAC